MGLRNSLEKVEEVINYIIHSIHDISELWSRKSSVYTHPGGKVSMQIVSDKGPYTKLNPSSTAPSVATVDGDGYVYGHSTGTATVTLANGDLSTSASVTVGASQVQDSTAIPEQDRTIDEVVIINPRATLEEGDEYALYAVGISNTMAPKYDPGYYNPIKFSSSDNSVAGIVFGTVMAYKPGTCTITASDLDNNASSSFTLTVVPKVEFTASAAETYVPEGIDNTGATDVTAAIATAIAYAADNGYKKISFPKGKYLMNGDNRPNGEMIELPSNMIIDFNGGEIHFDPNSVAVTTSYTMFDISDKENVWLRNLTVYGENETATTVIKKEHTRALWIGNNSRNIHVENCSFLYSPGNNVGLYFSHRGRLGFKPNNVVPGAVEAGGLDDNGNDIAVSCAWRTTLERDVSHLNHGYWSVGNFTLFELALMRSRIYDAFFYDSNHDLIYVRRNCFIHEVYYFPEGMVPKYCRLVIYQENEPTEDDGTGFGSFAQICDLLNPEDIYFKDCTFKYGIYTGLSPQGGRHVVIDHCTFVDNGDHDPYSHIDWEDGWKNAQGHIVRNCTFIRSTWGASTCKIINCGSTNITFHDNYCYNSNFNNKGENTMHRVFNNIFEGGSVTIKGKMDSIFAGNKSTATPSVGTDSMGDTYTISVDNEIMSS